MKRWREEEREAEIKGEREAEIEGERERGIERWK